MNPIRRGRSHIVDEFRKAQDGSILVGQTTNLEDLLNDIEANKSKYQEALSKNKFSGSMKLKEAQDICRIEELNKTVIKQKNEAEMLNKKRKRPARESKEERRQDDVWCAKCKKFEAKNFHESGVKLPIAKTTIKVVRKQN